MNELREGTSQSAGRRYSPDGRWLWDGERWTPVAGGGHTATVRPPQDSAPPAAGGRANLVLVLGIASLVAGGAVWAFSLNRAVSRVDDIVLAVLLMVGLVAGQLAIVLGLAPASRPRASGQIAGVACGLVAVSLLILFMGDLLLAL